MTKADLYMSIESYALEEDEEILVFWWDKSIFQDDYDHLTDDQWTKIVQDLDQCEGVNHNIGDIVCDAVADRITNQEAE